MRHKYRVSHLGLKDGVIIDFDTMEEAGQYAVLTKKAMKISGYPLHKVDIKPIPIREIAYDEEETDK